MKNHTWPKEKNPFLRFLFDKISGRGKTNWLSVKFARHEEYYRSLYEINCENREIPINTEVKVYVEKQNRDFDMGVNFYEVPGAGKIMLSRDCNHSIGKDTVGFSLGVSWSNSPYLGGVIGRAEAKKMAEFILESVLKEPLTETEQTIKDNIKRYNEIVEETGDINNFMLEFLLELGVDPREKYIKNKPEEQTLV